MKKLKVVLAIALAVVLLITILNAPTFSWFTRPQRQDGEMMVLQTKKAYNAFNGFDVTISTKKAANGVNYETDANADNALDGVNVSAHSRNYFCTTITNTSGSNQNVSLYASKLSIPTASTNGSLAIGVNGPTRNYRDYSSLAHPSFTTTTNTMRVYFETDRNISGWNSNDFYVCWKEAGEAIDGTGSNGIYYKMNKVDDSNHKDHYYADIPKTANQLFFSVANWGTNGENGTPNYWQRSQLMTNLSGDTQAWNNPQLWKITNTNNNGNATAVRYDTLGVGIDKYYSSISVAQGNTVDASLNRDWYVYGNGGSVEYYSGNTSLFTVDKNTGLIKAATNKTGEAILYTKVVNKDVYWDAMQVETTIKVTKAGNYEFTDVPIVRNILIPGTDDESTTTVENQVNVYWYVINNHDTNSLDYNIDGLYLGM